MPTGKIVLKTTEETMDAYQPSYVPLYGLFLPKGKQHSIEVGEAKFKQLSAVGDIRAKRITPKDTEIKQVAATDSSKIFKKYFLANQFTVSSLQSQDGVESVQAEVLDEHQVQADELFLLGDGTAGNNVLNNGLYWSGDANYTLETSSELPVSGRLEALHGLIAAAAQKANEVSGRKVVIMYGSTVALWNSIYATSSVAFKDLLQKVLGSDYSVVAMPTKITPAGASGFIVANYDKVELNYTKLPEIEAQGVNEEKMYVWTNFLLGSMMLDVKVKDAVIRQPVTLAT